VPAQRRLRGTQKLSARWERRETIGGASIMTFSTDEAERIYEASPRPDPETAKHVETYRKFTFYVTLAALAVPAAFAFILYWTT
jgi:hypothetical protein